jgi:hypothetical protein
VRHVLMSMKKNTKEEIMKCHPRFEKLRLLNDLPEDTWSGCINSTVDNCNLYQSFASNFARTEPQPLPPHTSYNIITENCIMYSSVMSYIVQDRHCEVKLRTACCWCSCNNKLCCCWSWRASTCHQETAPLHHGLSHLAISCFVHLN